MLIEAVEKLNLSGRKYHQIIKIARTIADLRNSVGIQMQDIAEALMKGKANDVKELVGQALKDGDCDIGLMGLDPKRGMDVDFSPPYA